MLKMTEIELESISDIERLFFKKNGMRGDIFYIARVNICPIVDLNG